jgi:hypothetical protein
LEAIESEVGARHAEMRRRIFAIFPSQQSDGTFGRLVIAGLSPAFAPSLVYEQRICFRRDQPDAHANEESTHDQPAAPEFAALCSGSDPIQQEPQHGPDHGHA